MRRAQVEMSPYEGEVRLSDLASGLKGLQAIDTVSLADIFRNAFVYPPYSIYTDIGVSTLGLASPSATGTARTRGSSATNANVREAHDGQWVHTYHRLLCEAVTRSCEAIGAPWMLQSGGKDSTSLAIAVAECRPETVCLTYLGGREEDEVASARHVARKLGLQHESLVCDPGRAYDRYLAMVDRIPLLTADFALLSYADITVEIASSSGQGIIDGLGSDIYFGVPAGRRHRVLEMMARRWRLPARLFDMPFVRDNFKTCFALATVQMDAFERLFPGSRFTDAEVDELLGRTVSSLSHERLGKLRDALDDMSSPHARRALSVKLAERAAAFPKGLFTAHATGLGLAYPFCDAALVEWVSTAVPAPLKVDRATGANKVLVRKHISRHFEALPYVADKGSFRFDLCGLAASRFEQVHAFAQQTSTLVPGAVSWLERYRHQLGNKYHASKFYLLAVTLPWLHSRMSGSGGVGREGLA